MSKDLYKGLIADHDDIRPLRPKKAPAKKNDLGKVDLSYLMDAPIAMESLCCVMQSGESKYGRDNWKAHDNPKRLTAALLRHLMAWQNGEEVDPESGLNHLAHVLANSVMMAENFSDRN